MRSCYPPSKLYRVAAQVKKDHPDATDVQSYKIDHDFLEKVKFWAELPSEEVEGIAYEIPARHIRSLAKYVTENTLGVPLNNLLYIMYQRMDGKLARLIFMLWQDYFNKKYFCDFLRTVVLNKPEEIKQITDNTELSNDTLIQWLESDNIPYAVGKECIRLQEKRRLHISDRLLTLGILSSSRLGRRCIEEYLTYCSRADYLEMTDSELLAGIKLLKPKATQTFIQNILSCLDASELQKYNLCGHYLRDNVCGSIGRKKYYSYINSLPDELKIKHKRWFNYLLLRDSFASSSDERLIFWSTYIPYSVDATRFQASETIVIVFEKFCVVEFTTKTMGPLYIYSRDVFDKDIKKLLRFENKQLRHILYNYHTRDAIRRIVHNSTYNQSWQHHTQTLLKQLHVTNCS